MFTLSGLPRTFLCHYTASHLPLSKKMILQDAAEMSWHEWYMHSVTVRWSDISVITFVCTELIWSIGMSSICGSLWTQYYRVV